ncbi:uncharacterized membrane protein HdeD (DUF308 family) [Algoriphagus boseongensis]|uniref:Uncharacterized membrane protein HdeD (DUF308 family) n=1 Tax=Algoriphagus boseongensis TaxID=1442587 RepID=A0A4R6TC45_9BACT|nr:HdeD family acid-resistance protein [Algoriphagus boseongensis]TDQ19034.1 uncharacterized membrane protein HdeD (DUF308 family) [Algoriphagus boseongensis]
MKALQKLWWLTLLRGIILVLLAFFVFRHPVEALVGVALYVGISLLVTGIVKAGASFSLRNTIPNWGWGLAGGLIDILFGFVLLSNPALTAASLPFVVGFWIIVSGIMSLAEAFQSRKEANSLWGFGMVSGLISIVIGYFITNNALVGMLTITTWMGIGFAIAGIVNIMIGFKLKTLKDF